MDHKEIEKKANEYILELAKARQELETDINIYNEVVARHKFRIDNSERHYNDVMESVRKFVSEICFNAGGNGEIDMINFIEDNMDLTDISLWYEYDQRGILNNNHISGLAQLANFITKK